jgi:hypothetical protein
MTDRSRGPSQSLAAPEAEVVGWWSPAVLFAVPGAVLVAAYGWLALDHGRLALWSTQVHENGRLSLGQTVFYFGHFMREVPVDVALALFLAAGFAGARRDLGGPCVPRAATRAWTVSAAAALFVGLAFAFAAAQNGADSALADLLQYRTREAVSVYGSHWHYHWLSTLWLGLAAPLAARVALGRVNHDPLAGMVGPLTWIAWGYFVAMTAVWGLTEEVFTSVRFAGHQAREIATLAVVTTPLTLGVLWCMTGRQSAALTSLVPTRATWLRVSLMVVIVVWLAVVMASGDVMSEGQSDNGLAAMVAAHVFEHGLDHVLVPLAAAAAWLFGKPERDS